MPPRSTAWPSNFTPATQTRNESFTASSGIRSWLRGAAGGPPPGTARVLRRRATDQLLRAGEIEEGLAAARQVLAQVGMRLPKSPITGIIYLLAWRAFLWLRGLRFVERDASSISVSELERLDVCWTISSALGVVDTFRAAAFQAR